MTDWRQRTRTVAFIALRIRHGFRPAGGLSIFEPRCFLIPLRVTTFAAFQQIGATFFLVDLLRRSGQSDQRAVFWCAALFSLLHFGVLLLGVSVSWTLTLVGLTFPAMLLWAWARVAWGMPWVGFAMHCGFYMVLASRNAAA